MPGTRLSFAIRAPASAPAPAPPTPHSAHSLRMANAIKFINCIVGVSIHSRKGLSTQPLCAIGTAKTIKFPLAGKVHNGPTICLDRGTQPHVHTCTHIYTLHTHTVADKCTHMDPFNFLLLFLCTLWKRCVISICLQL